MSSASEDFQRPSPTHVIAKDGLRVLLEIFSSSEEALGQHQDSVIVAVDIENVSGLGKDSPHLSAQVGLAILDTRNMSSTAPEKLISTYNWVIGSPEYHRQATLKFLFGKPVLVNRSDILDKIKTLVSCSQGTKYHSCST